MPKKPRRATSLKRLFVAGIVVAGTFALTDALFQLYANPPSSRWLILAGLTIFSGVFTIKVPSVPVTISVSEAFVFTIVLLFGTPAATVTVALDALMMSSWRHRAEPRKVLFNAAEPALSIWLASSLFFVIVGKPLTQQPRDVATLVLPILVLSLSYFLLNSWLTAIAVGLETRVGIAGLWRNHFCWLSLNYLVGASVAALIVRNSPDVNITTLGIIVPVLIVSYLTLKSSMGRVDDANRHLAQVNRMYMSTIETLAMAIDAKDQTTHGHIRRVQTHAIALSRALGVDDVQLLRAIEAAGLLHDMGKLGIPEHILNKPGKLSEAEFEIMKQHAAMGADMLAAIDFPYPVVPIVRHHHENWDGSGYPERLSGTNIPIGARILAVVDCFDALTSDRPYRPRLPEGDAFRVLIERRGSMYDPLVVDAFIGVHRHSYSRSDEERLADAPTPITSHDPASFGQLTDSDMAQLQLSTDRHVVSIARESVTLLSKTIPDVLCVFYLVNDNLNTFDAIAISDETAPSTPFLRIPAGQRLSGWVGANRQTVANSRAALDFGVSYSEMTLESAISTPVLIGVTLFGVLSAYRTVNKDFSKHDQTLIEYGARVLAKHLDDLRCRHFAGWTQGSS